MWSSSGRGMALGMATLAAEESLKGLIAEACVPQPSQQDLPLRGNLYPSVRHSMR